MKKAIFLLILLAMSFMSAFVCIGPVRADHQAKISVDPVYYKGGGETKTFNVTNLAFEGADPIIEVVITFPNIHDGDTDYKPVDYEFPEDWKATYEPALRQVTFVSLYPDDDDINIQPGEFELFTIVFEEGPTEDDKYVWIVSTTDKEKIAHTYYPEQWIDTKEPFVRIDYPEDGATVIATWDPYPNHHYLWINVTAKDEPKVANVKASGIKLVEVQVSNATWESNWRDITANNVDDTYYTKWYDLAQGSYTVTARALDNVDNEATDSNEFEYEIVGVWISISPEEGTVWRETTIDEGVYNGGKYTYGEKTLGTEVKVTGGGFTTNSKVNVFVEHAHWGRILVVKDAETDNNGAFTGSFLFPTAPQGIYAVNAIDIEGFEPLKPVWFTVVPEIIYKPVVVVGPAVIEVIATGLPKWTSGHPNIDCFVFDGTDALLGINHHVWKWGTDENGTLRSWCCKGGLAKPGFVMPVLESGTYEIAIRITGDYWNGTSEWDWRRTTTMVSNDLEVVSGFTDLMDAIDDLGLELDDIKARIIEIKDEVVIIETTVGRIEAKLDELEPMIVDIQGTVITIETIVGQIKGDVVKIEDDVVYMRPIVDDIKDDTGDIKDDTGDIKDDTGDIKITTDNLEDITPDTLKEDLQAIYDTVVATPTATYLPITAVLAAIAAIASCIAVVVVLTRLKVAA